MSYKEEWRGKIIKKIEFIAVCQKENECLNVIDFEEDTEDEAIQQFKNHLWKIRDNGLWMCPECIEHEENPKTEKEIALEERMDEVYSVRGALLQCAGIDISVSEAEKLYDKIVEMKENKNV